MAAITAANVVVTLNPEDIDNSPDGRIGMRTFPTVQFGNAALTYPALGVPMPALGKFGFHFAIKRAYIENPGNGYIYSFDRANHKVRVWLGAAQAAITVANHVGVAPTGNVAAPANHVGVAPTGNVAAPANHANLAIAAPANHSHDLIIAANSAGAIDAQIGCNSANKLVANIATAYTIPGNVAANGGVADGAVPAPANMANLTHNAPAFTGDAPANFVHSAPAFTGDVMANLTHTVTGGDAVLESPLAEMDNTVAPASVTLAMEMVGR